MSSTEQRARRKFTTEFKAQAVKRVLAGPAVARELGIAESLLHTWVTRHRLQESQGALHAEQVLEKRGFLRGMSRKGDCYDNAAMESFFHSLKVEQVHGVRYRTRENAKAEVVEYIETDYNPVRRHSTLDYLSPREFERRRAA
jgi:putative transposase